MTRTTPLAAALIALLAGPALSGCVARAAAAVVTAPIELAGSAVDAVTTTQSEADEDRGRELRKREEELGKLMRKYDKKVQQCAEGDRRACNDAQVLYAEIQELRKTLPAPPPEDRED